MGRRPTHWWGSTPGGGCCKTTHPPLGLRPGELGRSIDPNSSLTGGDGLPILHNSDAKSSATGSNAQRHARRSLERSVTRLDGKPGKRAGFGVACVRSPLGASKQKLGRCREYQSTAPA